MSAFTKHSLKKRMNRDLYKQIQEEGFVFKTFESTTEFKRLALHSSPDDELLLGHIHKILKSFFVPINNLQIVFEDFKQNDSNDLHTHLIAADYQVLIWVTEDSEFSGRDFLYEKVPSQTKRFRPSNGDICFMKTNDLRFRHGVSTLKSNS